MVLLHLCHRCNLQVAVAHCNFQLRGKESDSDAQFVEDYCNKLNIKYFLKCFKTEEYANLNKVSVQMAARELRYAWFQTIMEANGYDCLLTAHQADDNLETFLINLSRGTGIDGLKGINEKSDAIARPLLPFSREQILEFAKEAGISWREDSSNLETKYLRNKIRHHIVPQLKELHPTFLKNFNRTQEHLSDTSLIVKQHIHALKGQLFISDGNADHISVAALQGLVPLKQYIYLLFSAYGFNSDDVIALLSSNSGKLLQSHSHRLVRDRKVLLLEPLKLKPESSHTLLAEESVLNHPISLKLEVVRDMGKSSHKILYADKETLNSKLVLRKWKKGDYFYPLGMEGKKKVSKYFKDEKMDLISKENQWLLCSEGEIVWIVGRRADNRFRVTKKTKEILKITLEG